MRPRIVLLAIAMVASCASAASAADWHRPVRQAFDRGAFAQAARLAAHAASRTPQDPAPALWAGVALAMAGDVGQARSWLQYAATLDPRGTVGASARAWLAAVAVRYDPGDEQALASTALRANRRLAAAQARWIARAITYAAISYRLDPLLLGALVRVESRFDHGAISTAGAVGLAQLMPGTAEGLGLNPHHPLQNLVGAARLLRGHLNAFRSFPDPLSAALAAYHAGAAAVLRAGGRPPYAETARYVAAVQALYLRLVRERT